MITTYTPQIHRMRPPHERDQVHTWLHDRGFHENDVREIRLVGEGQVEVETIDRDADGKIQIITIDGEPCIKTSLSRFTLPTPPEWWPRRFA